MKLLGGRANGFARARFMLLVALVFLSTTGATVSDLNEAGKGAYARGDYATAERLFAQALAQAPDEPLLHYHRAVALMRLARWQEASTAFETALRLNPPADVAAAAKEGIRSVAPFVRAPRVKPHTDDDVSIPLRRVGGGWMASVRLNDLHTVEFLVDTGASSCVISPEVATALGIEPGPRAESVTIQVVGGRTTGPIVKLTSVRVGDAEAEDVAAVIHPISPGIDGLLGNSFLGRFTVTLDPQRGLLHLRPR
jgi:clan AA aspartic protease (TIGR02281 family)